MEKGKKNFFDEERVYMEITSNTKTFAQRGDFFLLTNEENWDYETIDLWEVKGCRINVYFKEMDECVPLSRYMTFNPCWLKPERQFSQKELEEIKTYKKV